MHMAKTRASGIFGDRRPQSTFIPGDEQMNFFEGNQTTK